MKNWTLKRGLEKKFSARHPWVFSSDLSHTPKGIDPGELVELRDSAGRFLARGYGHPNTLISFRVLSRDEHEKIDGAFWHSRLVRAAEARRQAGVDLWSHRWVYAEGDGLPGLIIDRFRLKSDAGHPAQAIIVQSSTAGIDRALPEIVGALENAVNQAATSHDPSVPDWSRTAIIIANDSRSRVLEGLAIEPKRVLRPLSEVDFERVTAVMQPSLAAAGEALFKIDLIGGQKTGFFLDQRMNVRAVGEVVSERLRHEPQPQPVPLRVLDICSYVGQWGGHLARIGRAFGQKFEVTVVDSSRKALELATVNVEANGGIARGLRLDVLEEMGVLPNAAFDVVICDPPAFIKKKKDIAAGQAAYLKLNREAMRKLAPKGLFFSSSCSGLLDDDEFRKILGRAAAANLGRDFRWIARGSHGPDHPQRPEFPQGSYLKSWLAVDVS